MATFMTILLYCIEHDPAAEATKITLADEIIDFVNSWKFDVRKIKDNALRSLVFDTMQVLSDYTYYLSDKFLRLIPNRDVLWFRNESWEEGEQLRNVLQPESYKKRCEIRDIYLRLYPIPEEASDVDTITIPTLKGAILIGQIIPLSSLFCSTILAIILGIPIP